MEICRNGQFLLWGGGSGSKRNQVQNAIFAFAFGDQVLSKSTVAMGSKTGSAKQRVFGLQYGGE